MNMDSNMTSNLLSPKFRPIMQVQAIETLNSSKPIQFKNVRHQNEAKELATRFLFECGMVNNIYIFLLIQPIYV